jgi:hypothetical protein
VGPYAGDFDGSTDYLSVGTISNLGAIQSITAWAYPLTASIPTVTSEGSGNHEIDTYSGAWRICDTGNGCSGPSETTSTWSFIAITFNGTNEKFYLNGVQAYSQGGTTLNTPGSFYIAAESANYRTWYGLLNDVRIYNRALSAAQIQAMYNGGK